MLEINNKSDLLVRVAYKKEKRKITALRFIIKPQKNNPALLLDRPTAKIKNMKLYQRLKTYFHLTSIQAQEVLTTHQQEDILENLKYVEKKIKEGSVKCIGAYTITAIKENYRILPNLFAIENSENTKAIKDAENKKRFRKRLEQRYDEEKELIVLQFALLLVNNFLVIQILLPVKYLISWLFAKTSSKYTFRKLI